MSKAIVTEPAPTFNCNAWFDWKEVKVNLQDYKGKYVVLFFHPLNFTFVCPTEIIEFSNQAQMFKYIFHLEKWTVK